MPHVAADYEARARKDTPPKWGISAERKEKQKGNEEEINLKFLALGGGFAHSNPQGALSVSTLFFNSNKRRKA